MLSHNIINEFIGKTYFAVVLSIDIYYLYRFTYDVKIFTGSKKSLIFLSVWKSLKGFEYS